MQQEGKNVTKEAEEKKPRKKEVASEGTHYYCLYCVKTFMTGVLLASLLVINGH